MTSPARRRALERLELVERWNAAALDLVNRAAVVDSDNQLAARNAWEIAALATAQALKVAAHIQEHEPPIEPLEDVLDELTGL